MVEDLGVEAKESAVREVAKLLPLPDLLQSIATIKADYIARQQVQFSLRFYALPFLFQLWNRYARIGMVTVFCAMDSMLTVTVYGQFLGKWRTT